MNYVLYSLPSVINTFLQSFPAISCFITSTQPFPVLSHPLILTDNYAHTHTHTHTHIYIYIYILPYSALLVTTLALIFSLTYLSYGKGEVYVLFLRYQGIMLNGWKCRCFTVITVFVLKRNLKIHRLLNLSNSQPFSKIFRLKSYVRLFDLTYGWNLISCLFWCSSVPLLARQATKRDKNFLLLEAISRVSGAWQLLAVYVIEELNDVTCRTRLSLL